MRLIVRNKFTVHLKEYILKHSCIFSVCVFDQLHYLYVTLKINNPVKFVLAVGVSWKCPLEIQERTVHLNLNKLGITNTW